MLLKKLKTFLMCCVMFASITLVPPASEGILNTNICIAETAEYSLVLRLSWV